MLHLHIFADDARNFLAFAPSFLKSTGGNLLQFKEKSGFSKKDDKIQKKHLRLCWVNLRTPFTGGAEAHN
ncbi:hypothetical protein, partial [Shimia sediminis]|uniref:hypothetical protein n=1 Tax=Shimia sediminis TaxID=2497945 RepID=UPI0019818090